MKHLLFIFAMMCFCADVAAQETLPAPKDTTVVPAAPRKRYTLQIDEPKPVPAQEDTVVKSEVIESNVVDVPGQEEIKSPSVETPVSGSQAVGESGEPLPPASGNPSVGESGEPLPPASQSPSVGESGEPLPPVSQSPSVGESGEPLSPVTESRNVGESGEPLPPATDSRSVGESGEPLSPATETQAIETQNFQSEDAEPTDDNVNDIQSPLTEAPVLNTQRFVREKVTTTSDPNGPKREWSNPPNFQGSQKQVTMIKKKPMTHKKHKRQNSHKYHRYHKKIKNPKI